MSINEKELSEIDNRSGCEWFRILTMDGPDSINVYMRSAHTPANPDYHNYAMMRFMDSNSEFTLVGLFPEALEALGRMCLDFAEAMKNKTIDAGAP